MLIEIILKITEKFTHKKLFIQQTIQKTADMKFLPL